jgi:F0F1-type ATP synthase membrane subunit b/b'
MKTAINSSLLTKRLADFRGQLTAADTAVEERQATLEEALGEGKATEKSLDDLAKARTRSEALRSAISKTTSELAEAQHAEARARRSAEIADFEAKLLSRLDALDAAAGKLIEQVGGAALQARSLDFLVQGLAEGAPSGTMVSSAMGTAVLIIAAAGRPGAREAIEHEARGFKGGLAGLRQRWLQAIASMKAQGLVA